MRHLRLGLRAPLLGALVVGVFACSAGSSPDTAPLDAGNNGDGSGNDGFTFDSNNDPDGLPTLKQISLSPPNAVVKIDLTSGAPVPGTQEFKATELQGDKEVDVTGSTTFTVDDPSLGSFAGNKFTSTTALPPGVLGKSSIVRGEPGKGVANVTVIALRVSGDKKDFFFTVPYKKDPDPPKDILKFGTNIKQVDVAILMDTTASMGEEIANLKGSLTSKIIPDLKKAIPNVGLAIAHFEDFPVKPFGYDGSAGGSGNVPYKLLQTVTVSESAAKSAVELLRVYQGGELPESAYEAQYQVLTGEGFTWTAATAGSIDPNKPSAGFSGGVRFRAGSLPVVVQISDASWFEKSTYDSLSGGKLSPHSKDDVVKAYDALKAKFVGVTSIIEKSTGGMDTPCTDSWSPSSPNYKKASCDSAQGYKQAVDMATATGSELSPSAFKGCAVGKCCTGVGGLPVDPIGGKCPLVYLAKPDGTGVADGIVGAIQAISVGSAFDVTAIPSNDPSNLDFKGAPVDATKFIDHIRAMKEGHAASGCAPKATKDGNGDGIDDTFIGVTVGDPVCFEVVAKKNETVEGAPNLPQFFKAFIDVVGLPGSIKLDRRDVLFLVPPKEPGVAK